MKYFLITCEHGGNKVPEPYESLFLQAQDVLLTHRAVDIGILPIAKKLALQFNFNLIFSETTRLLVDLNRSVNSPELFSEYSRNLSQAQKEQIIQQHYLSYRNKIEDDIKKAVAAGKKVIHLSLHSFTPILNGVERDCDLGILFDPSRHLEQEFCKRWKEILEKDPNKPLVKFNYPYQGVDDGLTTYLRTKFPDEKYAGIELEINQKLFADIETSIQVFDIIQYSLDQIIIA